MLAASTHVFSEIYLHANWHCKWDKPQITPDLEAALFAFIRDYCQKCKGLKFFGIGGTLDHVHIVFQIEPLADLDDWIGKVKGASSHWANKTHGAGRLYWQRGYGIVSFAKRDLAAVLKYVAEQKQRHASGRTNDTLEQHGVDERAGKTTPQEDEQGAAGKNE